MTRPGRPRTGAPTLREIATRTGYGLMTVSRALGPSPESVTEEKRRHIQAIAEELGYRPNLNIRALRRGSGSLVGLLCERFDVRAHDILIGLHDQLVPEGLLPCLMVMSHHPARDGLDVGTAAIQHLIERRVAAVLAVLPRPDGFPEWLDVLRREAHDRGVPTLLAGAIPQQSNLPLIRSDVPAAVGILVDQAASHRGRAALVRPSDDDPWETALGGEILRQARRRQVAVVTVEQSAEVAEDTVPIATCEGAALRLTHHRGQPATWIAGSDASGCPLPGLAVDLGNRALGAQAGQLIDAALRGEPLPSCTDVAPLTRRTS